MSHDEILQFFAKYIESELGIIYAEHNLFQLQNRLEEIMRFAGVGTLEDLYELTKKGLSAPLKQLVLDIATNNETSFFRDIKVFKAVESQVLPVIFEKSAQNKVLTIWSAASSSGQEALSLSILLLEWNKKNSTSFPFKITGTDISERVLAKAKAARFTQLEVQRGLSAPLLIKYFKKDSSDFWTANPEVTQHLEFRKLNLTEPFGFPRSFDLIFCRNVLIYQNVERKIDILKRIHAALTPGGFLVLGSGESLIGLSGDFTQLIAEGAVIYQKK